MAVANGAAVSSPPAEPMKRDKVMKLMHQVIQKITEGLPAWDELLASGSAEDFFTQVRGFVTVDAGVHG